MSIHHDNNRIWHYADVEIKQSGTYVKLIAPCGMTRRVTPETARQLAEDLLRAARKADAAPEATEKLDPEWFKEKDDERPDRSIAGRKCAARKSAMGCE